MSAINLTNVLLLETVKNKTLKKKKHAFILHDRHYYFYIFQVHLQVRKIVTGGWGGNVSNHIYKQRFYRVES